MTWLNFDLLQFEGQMFQESLNHRVSAAYMAAYSVLEKAYAETKEKLYGDLNKATDEEDLQLASQVIDYEESRWMRQREALAAMALALLATQTKSFLDEQKRRWDKTHPAHPKGYAGKGQLPKQVTEYRARFNIDLEKTDDFETVREVELARNCCLHNGGVPDKCYKTQTKQRFVDDNGEINLTPEQLDTTIGDLSQFGKSLIARMIEVRDKTPDS